MLKKSNTDIDHQSICFTISGNPMQKFYYYCTHFAALCTSYRQ